MPAKRRRQPGRPGPGPGGHRRLQHPQLSTLVTAVTKADLAGTLNSAQGITVFAPTNDAFAAVPKPTLDKALATPRAC